MKVPCRDSQNLLIDLNRSVCVSMYAYICFGLLVGQHHTPKCVCVQLSQVYDYALKFYVRVVCLKGFVYVCGLP